MQRREPEFTEYTGLYYRKVIEFVVYELSVKRTTAVSQNKATPEVIMNTL